jgi:hypothetical protein
MSISKDEWDALTPDEQWQYVEQRQATLYYISPLPSELTSERQARIKELIERIESNRFGQRSRIVEMGQFDLVSLSGEPINHVDHA